MNTLLHAAALLASLWLAVFCFQTLGNTFLGTAFIIVFFFVMVSMFDAIDADSERFRHR